ncbi:hypothetical protein Tco_0065040 [Tanacetum coccineum]
MLSRMLSRRLEVNHESEMAFELSDLQDHNLRITTVSYEVTAAGYVSTANEDCKKYSKSLLLLVVKLLLLDIEYYFKKIICC